jgi:glycosyltransferase involved in cell wall biosynthesis
MSNISLLVGLKNNLDYNKHFYSTTRSLYPDVEICFVSYGSTDGTHEWLNSLQDDNINYFYSDENKTFSDTFNKATKLATKEYVAYLHNDIVLTPGFSREFRKTYCLLIM